MLVEVHALDNRQFGISVAEIEGKAIGLRALRLFEQIAVGLHFLKGQQRDVVRIEMGIGHLYDIVDMQGVLPYRVLTDVGLTRWLVGLMREGYHLTLLIEHIVAVSILQGIDTIFTWCYTLDDKASASVGSGNAQQGLGLKSRIAEVVIKTHQDSLDRFKIGGIQHITRHLKSVNLLTR